MLPALTEPQSSTLWGMSVSVALEGRKEVGDIEDTLGCLVPRNSWIAEVQLGCRKKGLAGQEDSVGYSLMSKHITHPSCCT